MQSHDGRWAQTAGIVLVRQMPGSAKGVIFITLEDESGIANLVIWPAIFEKQRRIILSAGMMAVYGRIQRVGAAQEALPRRAADSAPAPWGAPASVALAGGSPRKKRHVERHIRIVMITALDAHHSQTAWIVNSSR